MQPYIEVSKNSFSVSPESDETLTMKGKRVSNGKPVGFL